MAFSHHRVFRRLRTARNRRNIRVAIVCGILAVWFVWMSLPRLVMPSEMMRGAMESVSNGFSFGEQAAAAPPKYRTNATSSGGWYVGGFPFDSYHLVSTHSQRRWSTIPLALVIDLLTAALLIGGGVFFFAAPDSRRSLRSVLRLHRGQNPYAAGLLGGSLCLLSALTVLHFWQCHRNNQNHSQFAQRGAQSSVRHPMFSATPKWFRAPWTHVNRIALFVPETVDPDSLSIRLSRYPGLQMVSLDGDVSDDVLDQIADVPLLNTLAWRRPSRVHDVRKLVERVEDVEAIEIRLPRYMPLQAEPGAPAVTARSVLDFTRNSRLQRLTLVNYPAALLDLDSLSNNVSLKEFRWRVAGQIRFPVRLHGCQELDDLSLSVSRRQESATVIDVRRMPKLQSLTLPGNTPLDLSLIDLPSLRSLAVHNDEFYEEVSDEWLESFPLLVGLTVVNAANLQSLEFNLEKLHRWDVRECPLIRSVSLCGVRDDDHAADDLAPLWQWLKQPQPINSIYLTKLSVAGVDFAELVAQKFLSSVWLMQSDATATQLEQIAHLPAIRDLRAETVPIDEQNVANLLAANQRWEVLLIDWSALSKIELRNLPHLKNAFANLELQADEIVLENLPRLESYLFTDKNVKKLEIVAVPQMGGIFLGGRLPNDARFEGLANLNHFCIGGGAITAEHLAFLQACPSLQTLCVPGCEVPSELIANLARWRKLSILDLRGVQVVGETPEPVLFSDQHAYALSSLSSLTRLNLGRTKITGQTISTLTSCNLLQALSVRGCRLSQQDLEPLTLLRMLMELDVGNRTQVPPELEGVTLRGYPGSTSEDSSMFDLTWNSIFTGQLKTRVQARLEQNRPLRRPRRNNPIVSRQPRPRAPTSPTL